MCAIACVATRSLVVTRTAGESGPCSAWLSRSTATTNGSACSSAIDEDLGRPGEQVDADLAEQLALRLGDVGVAGTGDEVDPLDRLGAEREGDDRLHAAEEVDLVGAGEVHRRDRRGRDLAADRRRARGDALDAGHLGGDDRHVRRSGQRVAATRHVGAGGADRDVLAGRGTTPGAVSISKSVRLSRAGPRRSGARCACTVSMSSIDLAGTPATIRSISSASSRNDGGDQRSKRSEYSRTAASPRARMSSMMPPRRWRRRHGVRWRRQTAAAADLSWVIIVALQGSGAARLYTYVLATVNAAPGPLSHPSDFSKQRGVVTDPPAERLDRGEPGRPVEAQRLRLRFAGAEAQHGDAGGARMLLEGGEQRLGHACSTVVGGDVHHVELRCRRVERRDGDAADRVAVDGGHPEAAERSGEVGGVERVRRGEPVATLDLGPQRRRSSPVPRWRRGRTRRSQPLRRPGQTSARRTCWPLTHCPPRSFWKCRSETSLAIV